MRKCCGGCHRHERADPEATILRRSGRRADRARLAEQGRLPEGGDPAEGGVEPLIAVPLRIPYSRATSLTNTHQLLGQIRAAVRTRLAGLSETCRDHTCRVTPEGRLGRH